MSVEWFPVECPKCGRVVAGNVYGRLETHSPVVPEGGRQYVCPNERYTPTPIHPPTKETAMPGFYDDPDIKKAAEGGDYVKFLNPGDSVSGTIRKLTKRDFDGRTAIEIEFDDETKATFGQVLMLRDLYVLQPEPGDTLTVTLVDTKKNGAKTLKLFKGEVTHANGEVEEFDHTAS
jgi:hypothetical protein